MKTLGDRLMASIDREGYKQNTFADLFGWPPSRVSNYVRNIREPCLSDIKMMAKKLKISESWLAFGHGHEDFFNLQEQLVVQGIPVLTWKEAANPPTLLDDYKAEGKKMLPYMFETGKKSFALVIRGDYMNPNPGIKASFLDGDTIIIDPEKPHKNGDFVIARIKDSSEAFFRQYIHDAGKHLLISLNPAYRNEMELNKDIEIIGVYVGLARKAE